MPIMIFLSHNVKDKPLADIIEKTIRKISLQKINAWFSSDERVGGGFNAGDNWYDKIISNITNCNVLIALLTPNSIERPWLYYEAGIAKGLNKIIVPVCIGMKREDMKTPLNITQAYQLTDKKSLEEFLGKILALCDFPLDKENFKDPIENALLGITEHKFDMEVNTTVNVEDIFDNLKMYLDQKITALLTTNEVEVQEHYHQVTNLDTYSIRFKLDFPKDKREFITEISNNDTFQDVTDNIYFNFKDILKPYTYMEKWIIVDDKSKNLLVLREITNRIPAKYVFPKDRNYTIMPLSKPYISTDSKARLPFLKEGLVKFKR